MPLNGVLSSAVVKLASIGVSLGWACGAWREGECLRNLFSPFGELSASLSAFLLVPRQDGAGNDADFER